MRAVPRKSSLPRPGAWLARRPTRRSFISQGILTTLSGGGADDEAEHVLTLLGCSLFDSARAAHARKQNPAAIPMTAAGFCLRRAGERPGTPAHPDQHECAVAVPDGPIRRSSHLPATGAAWN